MWSVEFFFIGQNRSSNQRSGMILEAVQEHTRQSFHFLKVPWAQILTFWGENWNEAFFYIKEI